MRLLFLGDIVGRPGRNAVIERLPSLRDRWRLDCVVINGENSAGGFGIAGYEMLKGLEGISTHEHEEWIPILENDQDMTRLASRLRQALSDHPACHAFLLRRHGMYTWGQTLPQAVRHVEIVEFLLEAVGRTAAMESPSWQS